MLLCDGGMHFFKHEQIRSVPRQETFTHAAVMLGQRRRQTDRQTDRYFIDRKEVITDLFVIEMREIYVHVYIQDR